jgi:hypothetical protein
MDGLHPKRFRAWRWEQQLVIFYGEIEEEFILNNAGWLERAQNKEHWRLIRHSFCDLEG